MADINVKLAAYVAGEREKLATTFPLMAKAVYRAWKPMVKNYFKTGKLPMDIIYDKNYQGAIRLFGREMAATKGQAHKWYNNYLYAKTKGMNSAASMLEGISKAYPRKGWPAGRHIDHSQFLRSQARNAYEPATKIRLGLNPFPEGGVALLP